MMLAVVPCSQMTHMKTQKTASNNDKHVRIHKHTATEQQPEVWDTDLACTCAAAVHTGHHQHHHTLLRDHPLAQSLSQRMQKSLMEQHHCHHLLRPPLTMKTRCRCPRHLYAVGYASVSCITFNMSRHITARTGQSGNRLVKSTC